VVQAGSVPYPVQDLCAYLTGPWRIVRRIRDFRLGLVGRLSGYGNFTPARRDLIYDEAGLLRFGSYVGEASRCYVFAFSCSATAHVHHADGSPFHALDLSSGNDDIHHRCGKDHYRGRYRALDPNAFAVSWDVAGPHKRYRMATIYRRAL
jgi:hypothetical protein